MFKRSGPWTQPRIGVAPAPVPFMPDLESKNEPVKPANAMPSYRPKFIKPFPKEKKKGKTNLDDLEE